MAGEPSDRRVALHGASLQVAFRGDGPTIVYLHAGDGLDPSRNLIECLAKHFHVIAPSPPGFDESGPVDAFHTVDDLSYLYLDLIDELGLDEAVLVGASFGAWLAVEIAIKSRQWIRKLVLINPVGIKIGTASDQDIVDVFYHTHRDVRRLLYVDGKPDDRNYSQVSPEIVTTAVRNREALTRFAWSPLMHNPRLASRLHRIRVPTLILKATHDKVVTERYTQAFADAITGARVECVADAGHYVHDEQPHHLAARIACFVGTTAADVPSGMRFSHRAEEPLR